MKAKENVKNNDINLQADTLPDLPATDEQADKTKGGREGQAGYAVWQSNFGAGS
jgi:hypothetical protein